jgi:aryl-alcohol dehydrogenase-like predicted oxidoreductase
VRVDLIERAQAMHPVAAVQSELSVWTRDFLDDVVPYCEEHGIVFVAYSPLGRGYLTGTVSTNTYEPTDRRWSYPRFQPGVLEQNQVIVDAVRRVAERHDCTPGQVALAWTLAISPAVLPIPGTKRPERLAENLAAAQVRLTADDLAELAGLPDTVGERY